MSRFVKYSIAILGVLLALPLVLHAMREPLARAVLAGFLPEGVRLETLDGLDLRADASRIDTLTVRLSPSLRLDLRGMELRYVLGELLRAHTLRSLSVETIDLQRVAASEPEVIIEPPEPENPASPTPELRVSEVLALLRDFPLGTVELPRITLPGSPRPLAFTLRDTGDALELRLLNEAMEVAGDFSMDAAGSARLAFSVTAAGATPVTMQATLEPDGANYRLSSEAVLRLDDVEAFLAEQLQTDLDSPVTAIDLAWQLDAQLADAVLESAATEITLALPAGASLSLDGVSEGLDALTATLTAASTLRFDADDGLVLASAALPLRLEGLWQSDAFRVTTELQPRVCRLTGLPECTLDFMLNGEMAALAFGAGEGPTRVYELALVTGGTLALNGSEFRVALAPGATLDTANVNGAAFTIERLALTTMSELTLAQDGGPPVLQADALMLLTHGVKTAGFEIGSLLHVEALDLTLGEEPAGTLKLWTENTYLGNPDELPVFELDMDVRLADGRVDFVLGSGLDGIVQATGTHDFGSGRGSLDASVPETTFTNGKSFASRLRNWHFPYDLLAGTLAADLELQWRPEAADTRVEGVFDARLTDAGGYHGELFFAGVDTTFNGSIDTGAALVLDTPPLRLGIASIDAGIPLSDIAVDYQFDRAANVFAISAFRATLLDGSLSAEAIRYDFDSESNSAELRFNNLEIARLIELVEYRGIEASGALSGSIPLSFTPAGIEVRGGRLYAEAPGGVIRYLDGAALAGGNPALDIMNQALGNYHFHSLESGIDYSPDGELLLSMKMQGTNPDMNNGQPINLNLNLSDNIPTLLQSLQAGRAIEDFFTEQYERSREEPEP